MTPLQVMQSTDHGSVGQDAETVEQLNESGDLRQLLRPFQVSVCHALVMHSVMQSCTVMTPVLSTGHCHVICDLRTKESSLGPEICDQQMIFLQSRWPPSPLYTTIRNLPCWLSVMLWSRLKAPHCLLFSCSPVNQDVIPRSKILLGRLENSCCLFHAMGNNLRSLQTVGLPQYLSIFHTKIPNLN